MKKLYTKIICLIVAAVAFLGVSLLSACSPYYTSSALGGNVFTNDKAESNGGFAVKKGEYIYFVNGAASQTDENSFGKTVKGSVMRISESDFSKRNYASVETVVPLVVYAGSTSAGIFIYGDYIYYTTPSTDKNADGEVQNGILEFKRTKLDGTETMRNYYLQLSDNTNEYRYVEAGGVVYILYVATSETLYGESTGVTNLHSFNTQSGEDKLIAYNVDKVLFDSEDLTNPRVYYTMNVYNYYTGANYSYNQVYTVTADSTAEKTYDTDSLVGLGWVTAEAAANDSSLEESRYINNGELVFDGIGTLKDVTPFNYAYGSTDNAKVNLLSYTYSLTKYQNDTLFYTRTTSNNDSAYLFSVTDATVTAGGWNPIDDNAGRENRILNDGSSSGSYKFLFDADGNLYGALIAESAGGLTVNKIGEDGRFQTDIVDGTIDGKASLYYHIISSGTVTMLFTDGDYLYYSLSGDGANGYSVNRIDFTQDYSYYSGMPEPDENGDVQTSYTTGVRILDIDASSSWYLPELIDGQLLFASETDQMSGFNYVMVADLRNASGEVMSNAEIAALNKQYESVSEAIEDYCADLNETYYANLQNALTFAFYTGDTEYIYDLAEATNAAALKTAEESDTAYVDVYSDRTLAVYKAYIEASGDWTDFSADKREISGETVYSNSRNYYYGVIGQLSETDAADYFDAFKTAYLQDYPEQPTWWESIGATAQGWFIAGMCIIGVLVVGGAVTLTVILVRRKKKSAEPRRRRRIKVDTTDDKSIDVYADEE